MTPDDDLTLAGEYVLGTLPLAERLAFETRLKAEPALQALVSDWENRLADLNDAYAEAPAPDLLPRIEARLFPVAARPRRRWFAWLGGVATAAALGIATLALLPPVAPPVLATLGAENSALRFDVRHDGQRLIAQRVAGAPAAADRSYELWAIAPGAAPVALGLIEAEGLTVAYPAPPPGWVLAVTIEPLGGAPEGVPTGPIVATAEISL